MPQDLTGWLVTCSDDEILIHPIESQPIQNVSNEVEEIVPNERSKERQYLYDYLMNVTSLLKQVKPDVQSATIGERRLWSEIVGRLARDCYGWVDGFTPEEFETMCGARDA
jgi:hypothetical protein